MATLMDLQPGTIWMQKKDPGNQANLIIKIEKAPFCGIQPCYGRTKGWLSGYPITRPFNPDAPATEMISYNHLPKVVYRYLICSSSKHLNRTTCSYANGVLHHYTRIH